MKVVFSATSMKDSLTRFFLVEHLALMIIAIVLITIGYIKSDREDDMMKKQKLLLIYYTIALILILVAIPWTFRALGAGWF
jgi:membrane protein DedA with SNARE-associated domain